MNLEKKVYEVEKRMSSYLEVNHKSYDSPIRSISQIEATSGLAEFKNIAVRTIEPKGDSAYIIPISDPHLGHQNCNINKLKAYIDLIMKTEDCYTVLVGDEAETATKTSVGMSMFEETQHIPEQMKLLCEMLYPLAQKGKILGMVPGNHAMRIAQITGINPTQQIAKAIGAEYLGYQGIINLSVGPQNYDVVIFHGTGGGGTNGSKVNSSEKIGKVIIADLYLTGHTHTKHKSEDCIYEVHNGKLYARRRHFVTCGSFLEYWHGYAEMKGLPPVSTGGVCIELMADMKNIVVHL